MRWWRAEITPQGMTERSRVAERRVRLSSTGADSAISGAPECVQRPRAAANDGVCMYARLCVYVCVCV